MKKTTTKIIENSFYIKRDEVHHFICSCGQHDQFKKEKRDKLLEVDIIDFRREDIDFSDFSDIYHPDNICTNCQNDKYLDMNALIYEDRTYYWSDIKWSYKSKVFQSRWELSAIIKIPKVINGLYDFAIEELIISSYIINHKGDELYIENASSFLKKRLWNSGKPLYIWNIISDNIKSEMVKFIIENPIDNIKWLKDESRIEALLFFLKNSGVRSKDIFDWENKEYFLEGINKYQTTPKILKYILNHRKEKSLLRAMFKSYKLSISTINRYNPVADYIFTRTIDDVNHLFKLINMDLNIKNTIFKGCSIVNILFFMDFLKQHYTQKSIVQLFLNVTVFHLKYYFVRDMINIFENSSVRDYIVRGFNKTPLDIQKIHDEIMRSYNRLKLCTISNDIISYSNCIKKSEVIIDNLTYKLPYSKKDLYNWGERLHNCLFSYSENLINGRSIIWGIYIDNILTYALEIRNNKIVQLSGIYNQRVDEYNKNKIEEWFRKIYIQNIIEDMVTPIY